MDIVFSLIVLSTLVQHLECAAPSVTSYRAILEMVMGESKIFSGESIRLKCSIPDVHQSTWNYVWYRGSEKLGQSGEIYVLWNARVKDGGKYYCKGSRETKLGEIHTLLSLPVEIEVDGGWAILEVPPYPVLVGDTLKITCRLRNNFPIHEVILYKDGVEVGIEGIQRVFHLTDVTLKDKGMYSCRASWDANKQTHSVVSSARPLQVLEIMTKPVLEIVTVNQTLPHRMTVICHLQYNARAPAPPISYYFYKDESRLGIASSENHSLVKKSPGKYSCKAQVTLWDLTRWSEPKIYTGN